MKNFIHKMILNQEHIKKIEALKNKHPLFKLSIDVFIIITFIAFATIVSFYLKDLKIQESNIIMTYLLSVIIISYLIESYGMSFLAAFLSVLTFNYFFTEPYFSLATYRSEYPVTFIFMFAAASITSALTMKIRHEVKIAVQREKRSFLLYRISQRLLNVSKETSVGTSVIEDFSKIMHTVAILSYCSPNGDLCEPYIYEDGTQVDVKWTLAAHQRTTMNEVYDRRMSKITMKKFRGDVNLFIVPVVGQSSTFGVLGFGLEDAETLSNEKRELCVIIASLLAMALERDLFNEEKKNVAIQIESERLRSNLLRAISHDLRTPLAGILGTTSTLLENGKSLTESQKLELVNNTHDEVKWLIHTVENILNLTQLENSHAKLNIKQEFIEEIVAQAVTRTSKQLSKHTLELSMPTELIMVDLDGRLIEQVLINLLDNASKHTPPGTMVKLIVTYFDTSILVQVIDNGPGMSQQSLDHLFNRFYTSSKNIDSGRRGIGLGLEICRAIIEAHQGKISAYNNQDKGATFEFSLPLRSPTNGL